MKINADILRIETNHVAPGQGCILISEPFLSGVYFSRSIILLVSYCEKGAVGLILNKKVDYPVENLFADFPDFNSEIYLGGPVAVDTVYFIHNLGDEIPGSIHIKGDLYWGGDFETLKIKIKLGLVTPKQVRFFLGYSGWNLDQLDEEINQNSWLVADISSSDVMNLDEQEMWLKLVKSLGEEYSLWENFPEDPTLN